MAIDIDTIIAAAQAARTLKDVDMKTMPQVFEPLLDKFVPLLSDYGAARQVLYDAQGRVISTPNQKVAVSASELEILLNTLLVKGDTANNNLFALGALLDALNGKIATETKQDTLNSKVATQTTLADILAKLIDAPATEAKQDTLNTKVATDAEIKILQSKVDALSTKIDTLKNGEDNYVDAQLKGSLVAVGGKNYPVSGGNTLRGLAADKPTATAAHAAIPYCYYLSIDTNVIEVTDGTSWVVF